MKVKNIKIMIKDRKEVLKNFAEALIKAKKGQEIKKHEELSFQNVETLRRFLTEKRIEILHTIKKKKPESIYALAQLVKRDLKSVDTDIKILEDLGLLSLKEIHEQRKRLKPIVDFDMLQVEIAI